MKKIQHYCLLLIAYCLINFNVLAQNNTLPSFTFPSQIKQYISFAVSSNAIPYHEVVHKIDSFFVYEDSIAGLTSALVSSAAGANSNTSSESIRSKYYRWKSHWESRVDEKGLYKSYGKSLVTNYNTTSTTCSEEHWISMGPTTQGSSEVQNIGRFNCIRVDPNDNLKMLASSEYGGIFKSIDGGVNWYNTTDDENLSVFGALDMEYNPNNSNFVVATTGIDKSGSAVPGGAGYGRGPIYSEDGGETWNTLFDLATSLSYLTSAEDNNAFYEVVIDPRSSTDFSGHLRFYFMTQHQLWVYDNTFATKFIKLKE